MATALSRRHTILFVSGYVVAAICWFVCVLTGWWWLNGFGWGVFFTTAMWRFTI